MCTIFSSGRGDAPDLLHAERPDLRVLALQAEAARSAALVSRPCVPSASTVISGDDVGAGLERRQRLALRVPARGRPCGRRARGRAATSSFVAAVSGSTATPSASACSARKRPSSETERRTLPWFRIVGGAGIRYGRAAREHVHGLAGHLAVGRDVRHREPALEELARSARGLTTAPESRCEPGCLPFSSTATGTSPSRSRTSGCSSSSCPSRIAQASPPGPPPTIDTPTSMRSSGGSVGRADRVGGAEWRWEVARPRHLRYARARTSSVSFGTIWCRSPTTPRSQKSKIGAFGSLLIATIVPAPCIPTLCWIAPEIPHAM